MKKLFSFLITLSLSLFVTSFPSSNENPSGFIVNGRDADISEFPHHLGLFDQGRFFCGAAVLSPQFALSAAHCLEFGTHPDLVTIKSSFTSNFQHFFTSDSFMGWINKSPCWRSFILHLAILFTSGIPND